MSTDDRKDLPPVNSPNFLERVREALSTYLGNRGDRLDRGVTLRDLVDSGIVSLRPGFLTRGGKDPVDGPGTDVEPSYEEDLTPPPTPTGFIATAAISNIFISHDGPNYTQGHGHAKTKVYGAKWVSGPLPVFADAVVITEFSGSTFAHATDPATTWHLWLKWVSVDGVESTTPAGGINGVVVTTGQDVALLLEALTGEITESQLYATLGSRIDLIDGNGAGSVNARILIETNDRITAVADEAIARANAINVEARRRGEQVQANAEALLRNVLSVNDTALQGIANIAQAKSELTSDFQAGIAAEAALRVSLDAKVTTNHSTALALIDDESVARVNGDNAEAAQRATLEAKVDTNHTSALAAVASESSARATAVSSEATQRELLATQFRGSYTGNDINALTTGLLYQERITRTTEDLALAQQITLLSAGAGEQFDWQTIWYFDSGIESWTGNGTPTATNGWLRPADQASGAYVSSPAGMAADGAKYGQVRMRIRKTGAPTFAGWLYWQGTLDSTWDNARRVALTEPTYDGNGIGLITANPAWGSITVNKIRVDLSSAQTATDCFELDWVAVGRPSPGASSAQLTSEQITRAAADTALASDISTLNAQVNNATNGLPATYAALLTEQTTRANADTANSNAITTLSAQVNNATTGLPATYAGLLAEQTARADADTAEAAARTTLAARVTTAEGNITATSSALTTEQTTRANADTTNANAISALSSQVNDASTGLPKTRADLIETQSTLASATAASSAEFRALRVQSQEIDETALRNILTTDANRTELQGTIALATQELRTEMTAGLAAEASARTALAAIVSTNQTTNAAAITDEQTARATADGALSTRAANLEASVTSINSSLATKATISYVDTAKADAISASASSIATVQARLDTGDFAAVKIESSASASSVTGLLAQYTVKLDVGGKVSGFGIASTGPTGPGSTFAIRADRFYIAPPASGAGSATDDIKPFIVQTTDATASNGTPIPAGVYINTAFIKNATITAAQIGSVRADSIQTGYLNADVSHAGSIYNGVAAYTLSAPDPVTGVITATPTNYTPGTTDFGNGYYLGQRQGAPTFFVGRATGTPNYVLWDGTNLTVRGTVYATAGELQGLTIKNASGQVLLASGTVANDILNSAITAAGLGAVKTDLANAPAGILNSNITAESLAVIRYDLANAPAGILNSNVTYAGLPDQKPPVNADRTADNVAAGIANQGFFATLNQITAGNAATYIANGAIGNAFIANAAILNANIADAAINSAKISDLAVGTLKIANNAVTVPNGAYVSAASGNGGWQTIASTAIYNDLSGANALVWFTAACSYSALRSVQYIIEWWVDGFHYANVFDSYPISGAYVPLATGTGVALNMGVGSHSFILKWYGQDGNVGITAGTLLVMGIKK